jgi:zinc protease
VSNPSPIRTLLIEDHNHPYVTFNVVLRFGALDDPPDKPGLAYLAGHLMMEGTTRYSREALMEEVDRLGSSLPIVIGRDYSTIRSDALERHLPRLAELTAECLIRYACPEREFARLRRQTEDAIRLLRQSDGDLAAHLAHRLLFDGHPYGNPIRGTESSLPRITREDVVAFLDRHICRGGMTVACSGDITPEALQAVLDGPFAGVREREVPEAAFPPERPLNGRTLFFVDKPERTQTQVVIGMPAIPTDHPDYYALRVANDIFGGTFTSRLCHEIREKRGWSYGVGSSFAPTLRTGS